MLKSDRDPPVLIGRGADQLIHFLDRCGNGFLAIDVHSRPQRGDAHRYVHVDPDRDRQDLRIGPPPGHELVHTII